MDLVIHTYGHIDAMYYVLNGIAMLMENIGDNLISTTAILATCYYAIKLAYASSSGNHTQYLTKIASMVLMINIVLAPKASMTIIDHVSKKKEIVDNLPYGFAVPVGIMEQFGYILTAGFEQAFGLVDSANYSDYGMVFGARLIKEARNWRIKSPEFIENMNVFLKRCVIREAMIGTRYTPKDLLTSGDKWELITANLSTLRKVSMRSSHKEGKDWQLVSCKEAAQDYIEPAFLSEVQLLKKKKEHSDYAQASKDSKLTPRTMKLISNALSKNIELVYSSYLGTNSSAEDLIKQQMMINALSDIGNDYGYARSTMQQETSWRIAGDLADTYLPMLLTLIKCLLYSSFIFLVPMMLLSGGGEKYLRYLTVVASLQLWPALNSILNMFIDLYSSNSLKDIADGIVSFANYSEVGRYADKIVAVASGLQMVIPMLAYGIMQGGASSIGQLAGSIMSGSQSTASAITSEVSTNNRSLDNYSQGNMQVAMQTGFKTDWNQSYAAGASSYQHMDGTMERVLGNGETIFQSGSGMTMSGGGVKFNVRESASSQIADNLSNAQSLMASDQRSYSDVSQSVYDKTSSYVASLAQRESSGQTIDYSKAGEHGTALQQAVSETRQLRERYGYDWRQAADTSLKAGISASTPGRGLFGFGVSGGGDISLSATNSSDQSFGNENILNKENNTRFDYSNVVKAASNEQFAKSNNIDTSYSNDIKRSYHNQQSLEGQIAKRAEQVETYSKALSQIQSNDASYDQDMYHDLEQKVASTYGVSNKDAHDMIERGDSRVMPVRQRMISDQVSEYIPAINSGQYRTSINNATTNLNEFSLEQQDKIDRNYIKGVQERAEQVGLSPNNKEFVRDNVSERADNLIHNNEQEISQTKMQNEISEMGLKGNIRKYEEDRVGQGGISKALGVATSIGTLGKSDPRIGGPTNPLVDNQEVTSKIIEVGKIQEEPKQRAAQIIDKKNK